MVFIEDPRAAVENFAWRGRGEGRYLAVAHDAGAQGSVEVNSEYEPYAFAPGAAMNSTCEILPPRQRAEWSGDVPTGHWRLSGVRDGLDGCLELDLRTAWQDQQDVAGDPWFLCLPDLTFPFSQGDHIQVLPVWTEGANAGVELVELDLGTTTPRAGGARLVIAEHGGPGPWGMSMTFVPEEGCELSIDACGVAASPGALELSGWGDTPFVARVGEVATVVNEAGEEAEFLVTMAEQTWVQHESCTGLSTPPGPRAQLVAVRDGSEESR